MNYHLEMNYLMSETRQVLALNTCIGANNPQEFGWISENIDEFRMQSINFYQKLLDAFLIKTGMRLYAFSLFENSLQNVAFQEMSINRINFSFLNQCNKFIVVFSKDMPSYLPDLETQDAFFDAMFGNGYALFEIKDYFAEGNSMTFYCQNQEVLSQLEEIAKTIGFVKID